MKNVNIRKAISYSINREEMVSAVYGRYTAAYGFVSPAITLDGTSYRKQASETMKEEYEQYAGDADKLIALFQKRVPAAVHFPESGRKGRAEHRWRLPDVCKRAR